MTKVSGLSYWYPACHMALSAITASSMKPTQSMVLLRLRGVMRLDLHAPLALRTDNKVRYGAINHQFWHD